MRYTLIMLLASTVVAHANMPPKEYDHKFRGELNTIEVPYGQARAYCRKHFNAGSMAVYGCAQLYTDGSCTIVISKPNKAINPGYDQQKVRRHEIGHCNGWPAHHPNALP